MQTQVKTYRGSQRGAASAFEADAVRMAKRGYVPTAQTWAPGGYGAGMFLLALLLCVVVVGLLIFLFMLVVKPAGTLTVTYVQDATAGIAEKTCPQCAERIKSAAVVCRYCGHAFPPGVAAAAASVAVTEPPARPVEGAYDLGRSLADLWRRRAFRVACYTLLGFWALGTAVSHLSGEGAVAAASAQPPRPVQPRPQVAQVASSASLPACPIGQPASRQVRWIEPSVALHEAPSDKAAKVPNPKMAAVAGRPDFVGVYRSELLHEDCVSEGWSHVAVVEPAALHGQAGWVRTAGLHAQQLDASGAEVFTDANFDWSKRTSRYRATIVSGVNKLRRENPGCKEIDTGSVDIDDDKGSRTNPVFYATCSEGMGAFNAFFSKSDVEKNVSLSGQHVDHAAAVDMCEAAAKSKAARPSTVDFSRVMSLSVVDFPNGRTRVQSTFTAQNAFGAEAKYSIQCFVDRTGLIEATVGEGN